MSEPSPPDASTDPDAPTGSGSPTEIDAPTGSASPTETSGPVPPVGTPSPADPAPAAASSGSGARPYAARDLNAPQYSLPAYATPATNDPVSQQQPVDAAPAHQYTTPSYAAPAGASPQAGPAGPAALPPYARGAGSPPPQYPGSPASAIGSDGPAAPGGVDPRPRGLAVWSLVLAGAGIIVAIGSWVTGGIGGSGLSFLLLFVAFILSLVALISRRQGGKGFGVAALLLSILGGLVSFIAAVAVLFGGFGPSYGDPSWEDDYSDDYSVPSLAAPGTDGQPDAGEVFAPPVPLVVVETAFGQEFEEGWWYVIVIDNPNSDYIFDALISVDAHAADGSALESTSAFATLQSGRSAVVGYFYDMGDADIASIEVTVPQPEAATLSPADETGSFTVQEVTGTSSDSGATTVTGTVSGSFADDQEFIAVTVLARAADGSIVAATTTYVDEVPGDGTPTAFEAWFEPLPAETTFEAFAHR
ncbi:hypothetical protein ACFT30_07060 [Microbacterium ureisolvens]|uniref:hypothetical protein n=1 Tax=Microbacterium ureisolvens TaxID=2781186 RepID=UPI003630E1B1